MAATALIKLTQGASIANGEALSGTTGTTVTVENVNNTDVQSWRIEMLYAPSAPTPNPTYTPTPGSPLLLAENAGTGTPTATFLPDNFVYGCYRLRLTVYSGPSYSGSFDVDIRNFGVPLPNQGLILPPYQRNPDPLPLQLKPDELNFSGGLFGWTGGPTPPLANMALYWADAGIIPTYTSATLPTLGAGAGQMVFVSDLAQPYWWTGSEWRSFTAEPLPFLPRRVEPASYSEIDLPLNESAPLWVNQGTQQAEGNWTGSASVIAGQSAFLDRGVQFQNGMDSGVLTGPTSANLQGWTNVTITAWVRVTQTPTVEGMVVYKSGYTSPQRTLSVGVDSLLRPVVYLEGYGALVTATAPESALTLNRWHHLAAAYDGAILSLYRDGVLLARDAYGGGLDWGPSATEQNAPWLVGNNELAGVSGARPFWGIIEAVQVLSTAWDDTEVMDAYLQAQGLRREQFVPPKTEANDTSSELWSPPATAHAYDDEFASTALDTGWGWWNATDSTAVAATEGGVDAYDATFTGSGDVPRYQASPGTRPSWLFLQSPANGKLFFMHKPVAVPADFLVVARLKFNQEVNPSDNNSLIGISLLADSGGNPDPNNRIDVLLNETDSLKMTAQAQIYSAGSPTIAETIDNRGRGQPFEYVALHRRSSINYYCWVGTASGNWMLVQAFGPGAVYQHLGLTIQNTNFSYIVGADFIRCYETDNFLL